MVIIPAYYYAKMLVEQTSSWRLERMYTHTAAEWNASL